MKQTAKMKMLKEMKSRRGTNTLILFRNGDNYEAYDKDAEIIGKVFTLETFIEDGVKMVKFQASDVEEYSNRLLDAEHAVCISEMRDESSNFVINIVQKENEQDSTDNQ